MFHHPEKNKIIYSIIVIRITVIRIKIVFSLHINIFMSSSPVCILW